MSMSVLSSPKSRHRKGSVTIWKTFSSPATPLMSMSETGTRPSRTTFSSSGPL